MPPSKKSKPDDTVLPGKGESLDDKMNNISNEVLNNFVISDPNLLTTYMKLLNTISCVAIGCINPTTGRPYNPSQFDHIF